MSKPQAQLTLASFSHKLQDGNQFFCQGTDGQWEGLGMSITKSNKVYKGCWQAGMQHGKGKMTSGSSFEFVGEFNRGKMDGVGRLKKKDNQIIGRFNFETLTGVGVTLQAMVELKGIFQNGSLSGFGEINDKANQVKYTGYFSQGLFEQVGKEFSSDGEYFGNFSEGMKSGVGLYRSPDQKETYLGYWNQDSKDVFGRQTLIDGNVFEGEFKGGIWDGIGKIDYRSKQFIYTGEIQKGKRSGFGRLESEKYMYAGRWEGDRKAGIGYQWISTGTTYFGDWVSNKKDGLGYEIGKDFNYKGEWRDDKPHGRGIVIMEGKNPTAAIFEAGVIVKYIKQTDVDQIIAKIDSFGFDTFLENSKKQLDAMEERLDGLINQLEAKYQKLVQSFSADEKSYNQNVRGAIDQFAQVEAEVGEIVTTVDRFWKEHNSVKLEQEKEIQLKEKQEQERKLAQERESARIKEEQEREQIRKREAAARQKEIEEQERVQKVLEEAKQKEILESQKRVNEQKAMINEEEIRKKAVEEIVQESKKKKEELEVLVEKLKIKEKSLAKDEKEIQSSKDSVKEEKKHVEEKIKELKQLQDKMNEEKERAKQEEKKSRLNKEYTTDKPSAEKNSAESKKAKAEIEKLKKINEAYEEQEKDYIDKVSKLEMKIKDLVKANDGLQAKNKEHEKTIEELLAQLAKRAEKEADSEEQSLSKVSKLQVELNEVSQKLKSEIDKSKNLDLNLKIAEKKLEADVNEKDDLKARLLKIDNEKKEIRIRSEKVEQMNIQQQEKEQEANKEKQGLEEKIRKMEKELAENKQTRDKELSEQKEKDRVREEKEQLALKSMEESYKKEIDLLKQKIGALNEGKEPSTIDKQEIEMLRGKLKTEEQAKSELENNLKKAEADLASEKKLRAEQSKKVDALEEQTRKLETKVAELEMAEKSFAKKEKEWNDIRDGLTNTVKNLKEKEAELKQELESKKTQDQEELKKRNDRLNKSYFEESEKIKNLFNLSSLRSPSDQMYLLDVSYDGSEVYIGGSHLQKVQNTGREIKHSQLKTVFGMSSSSRLSRERREDARGWENRGPSGRLEQCYFLQQDAAGSERAQGLH